MRRIKASNLNRGLVGAWCPSVAGNGLLLPDLSGYGNHGTLKGMTALDWITTNGQRGILFNGNNNTTDYAIRLPKNSFDTSIPFSVNTWFVPNNLSLFQQKYITSKWGASNGRNGYAIQLSENSANTLAVQIADSVGRTETTIDLTGFLNGLVNVAITYDQSVLKVFRNGNEITSNSINRNAASPAQNLFIGAGHRTDTTILGAFTGSVLEVRNHSQILSPSEIKQLYEGGPGYGLRLERKRTRFQVQGFNFGRYRRQQLIGTGVY